MFFICSLEVGVIDCGHELPLIQSNSCSSSLSNSSGDNISILEEAGIKMATDQELGADKASLVQRKPQYKSRILLSRLPQASNIGSVGRLWNRKFSSHMK